MNKIVSRISVIALLFASAFASAQVNEPQASSTEGYKTLIPETKQTLLKNMSMIANTRVGFRNEFQEGEYMGSRTSIEQFRLEIKGKVHEKVYFRFRDRYTRDQEAQTMDNMSRTTDLAFIRIDATEKFNFQIGKMCAAWGAYEFDMNPIDIYEYSDIIEYADNFLTGVSASYQVAPKHNITVQCLDSRTKSYDELYGGNPNHEASKAPLAFCGLWTGSLFDGKFNTMWGYSLLNDAKNANVNYVALGNQVKLGKFTVEYDFKWSDEDLDRTGIISEDVNGTIPYAVDNTLYIGHWLHLYYRVNPKINVALIGMMDVAQWKDGEDLYPEKNTDDFRTAYGVIPTFEYYPFEDLNLRFYCNWIGRSYEYSDFAKSSFGMKDYNKGRLTIGLVSPLGIF